MAHICGSRPGANRYDENQTNDQRDDYQNLILLCPTHHTLIDRKENEDVYTVASLHAMKTAHENWVRERLDTGIMSNREDIARSILPLLEENRVSWAQYGPESELARTQPNNEALHSVWVSERLSVIVPNNRKMEAQLNKHIDQFDAGEQAVIMTFLMHVRSYEQWVADVIPYAAVKRFPVEFDDLIRELADACA